MREFSASGVAACAVGAFHFGAGQGALAGSGASSAGEVPAFFGGLADGVPFGPVAVQVGDAAVAADELDDYVDVVVAVDAQAVVDGDPAAAAAAFSVGAEAEAVDGFFDDPAPSFVAELAVFGGEGQRDVVDEAATDLDLVQYSWGVQGGDQPGAAFVVVSEADSAGSSSQAVSQAAIRCGLVCSLCLPGPNR
jgi:hypothetical protein